MRTTIIALGLAALTLAPMAAAQTDPTGPTDNTAAAPAGVTITRDVVYGHKIGMALTYDVVRPANANGTAVIFMVSGAWRSTWQPPEERMATFRPFLDRGITMIAMHHGSTPKFNSADAVIDIRRGVRHVKLHAASYGIDPDRIGTYGRSAGGHLALSAGFMADDGDPSSPDPVLRQGGRVKTVAAWFPPTDMRMYGRSPTVTWDTPERAASASPVLFVDAADPPTLIITGDTDRTVPIAHSYAMVEQLKANNIEHVLTVYPGADHGFRHPEEGKAAELSASATRDVVEWFVARL